MSAATGPWAHAPAIAGISVTVEDDPLGLGPGRLFGLARRRNPRRSHLFVSTVLGKHLPVEPQVALRFGALLASRWAHTPEAPLTVLGFAETATALGHAVAAALPGAHYVHSTRRAGEALIAFQEEHSHAPSHRVLCAPAWFAHPGPVLLVDDELTSGRTALNTIRALHAASPRRRYGVAALLDWRTGADRAAFRSLEAELGITIDVVALQSGRFTAEPDDRAAQAGPPDTKAPASPPPAIAEHAFPDAPRLHARLGWTAADGEALDVLAEEVAARLAPRLAGDAPVLCLGVEEFMFPPMCLAAALARAIAAPVLFQSTTRSPIAVRDEPGYAVRHGATFPAIDDPGRESHLYNVAPGVHGAAIVFHEGPVPAPRLIGLSARLPVPIVHHVFLGSAPQ